MMPIYTKDKKPLEKTPFLSSMEKSYGMEVPMMNYISNQNIKMHHSLLKMS